LREAVAEGPILFRGLENIYERVLRPDAGAFAEQLGNPPEQTLLLFRGAGVEHGDLKAIPPPTMAPTIAATTGRSGLNDPLSATGDSQP